MTSYKITAAILMTMLLIGCGMADKAKKDEFFTSGSREADQRAEQRVAKEQQFHGKGEGDGKTADSKKSLYTHLGGEKGIADIVDDFVNRALADPRVNWQRKGVSSGVLRRKAMEWDASPEHVTVLKKHITQFLTLATGGPAKYDGLEMKDAHKGMRISNAEFDAAIGDLKATLDKIGLAVGDQKELLAIVESTRPQIVEQR
jgi:hemoglobin